MTDKTKDLTHIGALFSAKKLKQLKRIAEGPTPIQKRIIDTAGIFGGDDPEKILFQHSVFCQVYFPSRDPGDETELWYRSNGAVDMRVHRGEAKMPDGTWQNVPLPYGPKCRLVFMHLNQLALIKKTPIIEVEDSLTAFVKRVLRLDGNGRDIRMVKDQLARISASTIRMGMLHETERGTTAKTGKLDIVSGFDLWQPKDERQRVLWPSTVTLGTDYFNSLLEHAVPLREEHISALSHSAMALDIYVWLAQRLHRIPEDKPVRVSWPALHNQFGQGYNPNRMDRFRQVFNVALREVLAVYSAAKVTQSDSKAPYRYSTGGEYVWRERMSKGLMLHNSPPPIPPRKLFLVK